MTHLLASAMAEHGLLLLQDKNLPSAVGMITGERVAGSWWSHPRAHEIVRRLQELDETGDVIATKLIGGKVTFVHRKLWPALVAVGSARQSWQMRGLSPAARKLLREVDQRGAVRTSGAASKQLQERLLVRAHEEHTESGRHETVLERWSESRMTPAKGRHQLERAATAMGAELHDLPWNRFAVT